ncbi:hypothetical protein ACF060_31110 [Streptomyces werraensis]|uniref:hypothetical protein n=1 Tax=Streptomyces werraensis TaxID=68284 RepID=UPI0036FDBBFB
MPKKTDPEKAAQALQALRAAAQRYKKAHGQEKATARVALHQSILTAVHEAGVRQAEASRAAGISKAQVSRLVRGATSGKHKLPPAQYLIDTLPREEIAARYRRGESAGSLGDAFGCSAKTIGDVLRRAGVPLREGRTIDLPVPVEELARRYLEERALLQDLAAEYGITVNLISRRLAKAGVVVPVGKRRMDLPDDEIVARHRSGESVASLSRTFGVSSPTIKRRLEEASRTSA